MENLVVKHRSGESYKIILPRGNVSEQSLTPESFWNESSAQQFVNNLVVSQGIWRDIIHQCDSFSTSCMSHDNIEKQVSSLIINDKIKFYPVKIMDTVEHPPEKRVLKSDNIIYRFEPSSSLLFMKSAETQSFKSIDDAYTFLNKVSNSEAELADIAKELNIDIPKTAYTHEGGITDILSEELISGNIVIIVDKSSSTPPKDKENQTENSTNNKKADLGSRNNKDKTKDEIKPCIYQSFKLSCCHGRHVTLDPSKPLQDGQIPKLQVVSSQNENLKDAEGAPIFETLTVDAVIESVCDSHKTNFITINDSNTKLIGQQSDGKLAKFKSPSNKIKVSGMSGVLKYLWLPNVEKEGLKTYKVFAADICDSSKFDGKGKYIQVDVYPHMKWNLVFNINLGSIKNDNKPSKNKLAFEGSLKLQQDNAKADEFTVDYKKKLEKFDKSLTSFKNILTKNIFDKFRDGRDFEINVTLPKIALDYATEFKEKPGSPLVVRTHEFNFSASPFVKVAGTVDILPIIVKFLSSWWSSLFNAFFDWAKQKFGEKDGKAHIETNIFFKVTAEGSLGAKFSHKRDESEKSSITGEPVTSKITFKAEGEAKLDGHIYVVKVEVVLKAGLETSIDIGLSMSSDDLNADKENSQPDDAPYISLDFMFNGIKIYLEKEIQLKIEKSSSTDFGDGLFGKVADDALDEDEEVGTKEVKRSEPRTWLKMSDKHQFKYYLDKEDKEKVKNQKQLKSETGKLHQQQKQDKFDYQMKTAKEKNEKLISNLKKRINREPPKAL